MNIEHQESRSIAADRTEIYQQSWQPADRPIQAIVAIVHGYAEHSNRYIHVATNLAAQGFAVYSFDLRGHGKSGGNRCFVNSFSDYLTDLDRFLTEIRQHHPQRELFLLGHSLGGAIALRYVLDYQTSLQGLILSAPFLGSRAENTPAPVVASIQLLSQFLPKLPSVRVDSSQISSDPAIVQAYRTDPLVNTAKMPLRTLAEIFRNIHQIQHRQHAIELPILIMHGTADGLAHVSHSESLAAGVQSTDKTLKLYPGLYHEIFNEPDRSRVFTDLHQWLTTHSS
jgi:alpha-beta hydrolase superfamily lysophospholipase